MRGGLKILLGARVGIVLLLLVLAGSAYAIRRSHVEGGAVSLAVRAWDIQYSRGVPNRPTLLPQGLGWYINFPRFSGQPSDCNVNYDCPSLKYVTTQYHPAITQQHLTMLVQAKNVNGAIFEYRTERENNCDSPAGVRFYLEHVDADYNNEFHRWWSRSAMQLRDASSPVFLSETFDPQNWTDVNGSRGDVYPGQFSDVLAHPGRVGITFGGGCFYGHGVFVTGGSAAFVLYDYSLW